MITVYLLVTVISIPYIGKKIIINCSPLSSSSHPVTETGSDSTIIQSAPGQWHPTPVILLGKSHGRRSLVGCSPWGREEPDTTEWLHFHLLLSCIGGGNGNPLQCSCLENPRDGGAWWAAVYGVAQSRTGLKQLSSPSSSTWSRYRHDSLTAFLVIQRSVY